MRILLHSVFAFSITALSVSAGQLPDDLVNKLSAAIHDLCPDAQVGVSNGVFTEKRSTMMFTLHSKSKTGEVFPQTYQQEGPNFKGFILTVSQQEGRYQGAAMIPQTLQGPYFPTFIDAPATEDGNNHYWVTFSYGGRFDEKVRSAILDLLPRTKFQPQHAADGSQPIRSYTNPTPSATGSRR